MKKPCFTLALCALMLSFTSIAQDPPTMYMIHLDYVKPSKLQEYREAAMHWKKTMQEAGSEEMGYNAFSTDDFRFAFSIPINGMADIDEMYGKMMEILGEEKMKEMMSKFDGNFTSHEEFILKHELELSYMPEGIPDDATFRHWDYYYIKPEMWNQAMDLAKRYRDYAERKGLSHYAIFTNGFGGEMNYILVYRWNKDLLNHVMDSNSDQEKMDEEGLKMQAEILEYIDRFEHFNGALEPDLSYMTADN